MYLFSILRHYKYDQTINKKINELFNNITLFETTTIYFIL